MTEQELKCRIETLAPGTIADVEDLTGGHDHWSATVVSPVFVGKSTIERHRMVFNLLKNEVESNEVHALTLKTYTPEQYERIQNVR